MQTVIIVIHLMIVIAMVAVILLQRSEGGALGIGGGGGGGGLFTARGSANLLTRTTTILAVTFFVTSLALALLAKEASNAPSLLDTNAPGDDGALGTDTITGEGEGILDLLREQSGEGAAVPAPPTDDGPTAAIDDVPAAPAAPAAPQAPTGN